MLIDWFTVVAQIVNFLVLVALMKHFLYGRLIRAIDEREKRFETRAAEAEEKNRAASQRLEDLQIQAENQERDRERMLADAKNEAGREHKEMVDKARESVRALEARWHQDLEREQNAFLSEIRRRSAAEILAVTRRALADLACSDVEQCAMRAFLAKLGSLNGTAARELGSGEIAILSATEIPEPLREEIRQTLEKQLGRPVLLRFEHAPDMAWGLELRANGRRLGWNSETYIQSLEENLRAALDRRSETVLPR